MKYKAVVFDMDGVIFDTERIIFEEWQDISQKYGIKDIDKVFYKCIGVTAVSTEKIFREYYGEDFPYKTYQKEASQMFHSKYDNGRLPMKNGVEELLSFLKNKGYLVGLASSTRYAVVKQEIEDAGIIKYFDDLTGGDMLEKSKPEPDIYLMACDNLGVNPNEAIAIEDSYNGIRAAYRAGMMPVMVPDMVGPNDEMRKISGKIFDSLNDFREWLDKK